MMGSGSVCIKETTPLIVLWRKLWVQFRKIDNTYSRTIEAGLSHSTWLRFPNFKGKYRLHCNISYFAVHSWKNTNFAWIPLNAVQNIDKVRGSSQIVKSFPQRTDVIRWKPSFMETGYIVHRDGNEKAETSGGTIQKVQMLFQNYSTLIIWAVSSRFQISPTMVHRSLGKSLFWFLIRFKFFKQWKKVTNKTSLNWMEMVLLSWRVVLYTYQVLFYLINACFASTVSSECKRKNAECWASR